MSYNKKVKKIDLKNLFVEVSNIKVPKNMRLKNLDNASGMSL